METGKFTGIHPIETIAAGVSVDRMHVERISVESHRVGISVGESYPLTV